RRIVEQDSLAAFAAHDLVAFLQFLEELKPQSDIALRTPAVHHLRYTDAAPALSSVLVPLEDRGSDLGSDGGALGLQFGGSLLVDSGALARLLFLLLHFRLFRLQSSLRSLDVFLQGLGFRHQLQDAIFGLANFGLAEIDLVLEGTILLIGLRLQHLIFQL